MLKPACLFVACALASLAVAFPAAAQTVAFEQHNLEDGSATLVHEVIIPADPAAVWQAISTPQGWQTWAVPLAWTDPAAPDHMETAYDPAANIGDPGNIRHQILQQIPGVSFTFRTVKAPEGFPHAEAYYRVTSAFELSAQGSDTLVRLTTSGYPPGEAGAQLIGFFTQGNALSLGDLHRSFAEGPRDWRASAAD